MIPFQCNFLSRFNSSKFLQNRHPTRYFFSNPKPYLFRLEFRKIWQYQPRIFPSPFLPKSTSRGLKSETWKAIRPNKHTKKLLSKSNAFPTVSNARETSFRNPRCQVSRKLINSRLGGNGSLEEIRGGGGEVYLLTVTTPGEKGFERKTPIGRVCLRKLKF